MVIWSQKHVYSQLLLNYIVAGYESIARLLIQHEAKINIKDNRGRTSLHYATEGGNLQWKFIQFTQMFSLSKKKCLIICWGHENVVKLLVEHGADPQIKTPGETSIDLAEMNGNIESCI